MTEMLQEFREFAQMLAEWDQNYIVPDEKWLLIKFNFLLIFLYTPVVILVREFYFFCRRTTLHQLVFVILPILMYVAFLWYHAGWGSLGARIIDLVEFECAIFRRIAAFLKYIIGSPVYNFFSVIFSLVLTVFQILVHGKDPRHFFDSLFLGFEGFILMVIFLSLMDEVIDEKQFPRWNVFLKRAYLVGLVFAIYYSHVYLILYGES